MKIQTTLIGLLSFSFMACSELAQEKQDLQNAADQYGTAQFAEYDLTGGEEDVEISDEASVRQSLLSEEAQGVLDTIRENHEQRRYNTVEACGGDVSLFESTRNAMQEIKDNADLSKEEKHELIRNFREDQQDELQAQRVIMDECKEAQPDLFAPQEGAKELHQACFPERSGKKMKKRGSKSGFIAKLQGKSKGEKRSRKGPMKKPHLLSDEQAQAFSDSLTSEACTAALAGE